mmetsp:Transcript_18952/g.41287  ORF Transcript_18952/g.41287 Transcript_18952/m.41287 type:complete len:475 (+) Transcript_18952:389-1813(+)|eukprot:CAMPEP_0178477544 /NCGR_PEP_ID=MMETSP0696-20121128/4185_1 /TAXON_ID=265572 /ORGANISM="Extubocellulus spinifer, Strain CCMP396" /LENGTH=474 /DNA_ID=CAMNT_0020104857 /DNA_START=340 /DNA_END=1764 /DNA_ORIENTATION=-
MGNVISLPFKILRTTLNFYGGLYYYLFGAGRTSPYTLLDPSSSSSDSSSSDTATAAATTIPSYLRPNPQNDTPSTILFKRHARIHLFTLSSAFYLYPRPHYRKGSYRDDILDNFRNVAIPGTGIPLSLIVTSRFLALGFVLTANPVICFISALHLWLKTNFQSSISDEYATRLLAPDDWFSYWRLNCRIVGLHSLLNDHPPGYDMENKWTFLSEGERLGVPVSPTLKTPGLVVKHRNEEGGLGIYFYRNATVGGDWIIQERIQNSDWVAGLLPVNAPLSTFRVITMSRASIDLGTIDQATKEDIVALSCVFRAGREGADTDHSSILFDVDTTTGLLRGGTTNAHWYKLGPWQMILPGIGIGCPWRSTHGYTHHPDGNIPITGKVVPDIKDMLNLVEESHLRLCPDVPFVGWDVVLSSDPKLPVCLLEVNLSCNFFRGSFDKEIYLDFIDDALVKLQHQRLSADEEGKIFKVKTT